MSDFPDVTLLVLNARQGPAPFRRKRSGDLCCSDEFKTTQLSGAFLRRNAVYTLGVLVPE